MSLFLTWVVATICFFGGFALSYLFAANRLHDREAAKQHLIALLMLVDPQFMFRDRTIDLVMQIDNYIARQNIRIKDLEMENKNLEALLDQSKGVTNANVSLR